jgi:hypothetical protein
VIGHCHPRHRPFICDAYRDRRLCGRILQSVCQEVGDYLADPVGIEFERNGPIRQAEGDGPRRPRHPHLLDHVAGRRAQVAPLAPELQATGLDTGDIQQVLDEVVQLVGLAVGSLEQLKRSL